MSNEAKIAAWESVRGKIMKTGRLALSNTFEVISMGLETLDWAIGARDAEGQYGLPRGSIVEIAGPESSGKTTHALQVCANALQTYPDNPILIIDAEKTTTPEYARQFGIDPNDPRVMIYRPDSIKDMDGLVEKILRDDNVMPPSVIVVDSIPAIDMGAERNVEEKNVKVGERAGYMSEMISRWNSRIQDKKILLIMINQLRDVIDTNQYAVKFATSNFEKTNKTTGGRALKFFFSIRILLQPIKFRREVMECFATGEDQETDTAVYLRAHIVKNKCSMAPDKFRKADYYMHLLKGIDRVQSLYDLGRKHKVIITKGAWFQFDPERLPGLEKYKAMGEDAFVKLLRSQPSDERDQLFESMLNAMGWAEAKTATEIKSKATVIVDQLAGTKTKRVPLEAIERAQEKDTVEEKAVELGLFEKKGRKYYYGNKSAADPEKLMKMLKAADRSLVAAQVDEMLSQSEVVIEQDEIEEDEIASYAASEIAEEQKEQEVGVV